MAKMESNSIDFIVTDPPYGLYFMNKKWDKETPSVEYWKEALRVCKPGSMMAVFGGSRTHHRLMCAIEDAGWEIRDVIMWIYGSGFPKSHNHFGLEGYGTALKPAYEPIIIAMRPCEGTFANNADKWGLAGININDSRIGNENIVNNKKSYLENTGEFVCGGGENGFKYTNKEINQGRFPANIILDEEAGQLLDEQSGILKSGKIGKIETESKNQIYGSRKLGNVNEFEKNSGGASRFFYSAKASSKERNLGCEKNTHPTVKPISLMKYIINLLAPPNNPTLLDPFSGSGSTLIAAKELGINAIGIEISEEYCEIARNRINHYKEAI